MTDDYTPGELMRELDRLRREVDGAVAHSRRTRTMAIAIVTMVCSVTGFFYWLHIADPNLHINIVTWAVETFQLKHGV